MDNEGLKKLVYAVTQAIHEAVNEGKDGEAAVDFVGLFVVEDEHSTCVTISSTFDSETTHRVLEDAAETTRDHGYPPEGGRLQ